MIEFGCKNCGHKLSVQDQYSGERINCPKCGNVCVVPDNSEKIKFHCENCDQSINVPKIHAGKKGKCPKCKYPFVVPSLKREPSEDLYQEETEEYEESVGVDRRIIVGISATAAVVVLGLIILATVLRTSGSRLSERPEGLRGQQQVTDPRPLIITKKKATLIMKTLGIITFFLLAIIISVNLHKRNSSRKEIVMVKSELDGTKWIVNIVIVILFIWLLYWLRETFFGWLGPWRGPGDP